MPDLIFTTKGQAEALAAQEAVRKKSKELKDEFEKGAKATGQWDESLDKLKRKGESALRSIQTEQEKILDKIGAIEEAQEKGLIPPDEAEKAIIRLRQRWVDIDQATQAAKAKSEEYAEAQADVQREAEKAMASVATDLERVADKIAAVERAAKDGLVPPAEAEEAVRRLREEYEALEAKTNDVKENTSSLEGVIKKTFNPQTILKWGAGLLSATAILSTMEREFDDLQKRIDKRQEALLAPKAKVEKFESDIAAAEKAGDEEAAQKLRQERDAYLATPEGMAYQAVSGRQQAAEEGHRRLAPLGDPNQLSSKDVEQLDAFLREIGQGYATRALRSFAKAMDDGSVTLDEATDLLRQAADDIKSVQQAQTVRDYLGGTEYTLPGRELSTVEQARVAEIERYQQELARSSEQAQQAREEQIRLLRQIAEDGVGGIGTSAL